MSRSIGMVANASAACGSKCVPRPLAISSRASCTGSAVRYGRLEEITRHYETLTSGGATGAPALAQVN